RSGGGGAVLMPIGGRKPGGQNWNLGQFTMLSSRRTSSAITTSGTAAFEEHEATQSGRAWAGDAPASILHDAFLLLPAIFVVTRRPAFRQRWDRGCRLWTKGST